MGLDSIGVNPIKALCYAAIVNGTIAPVLMFFIFKIGRDATVMGTFTCSRWGRRVGTVLSAAS